MLQALRCNTQTFCRKIDFCTNFLNFNKMNILEIFYSLMRRTKWDQNHPIWKLFRDIEKKILIQGFRVNNPKQCSKRIILVSFCSSHLAIQIATMFILWKFKNWCKNRFFRKNSKKFVYYNEELVTNSNAIISKTTTIQNMP